MGDRYRQLRRRLDVIPSSFQILKASGSSDLILVSIGSPGRVGDRWPAAASA